MSDELALASLLPERLISLQNGNNKFHRSASGSNNLNSSSGIDCIDVAGSG
jgi:hypothetical protein